MKSISTITKVYVDDLLHIIHSGRQLLLHQGELPVSYWLNNGL